VREGVDPTLLSVTWRHEAIPSFGSYPLPHARHTRDGRGSIGYDVVPLQKTHPLDRNRKTNQIWLSSVSITIISSIADHNPYLANKISG
jgi:hypothetical protein